MAHTRILFRVFSVLLSLLFTKSIYIISKWKIMLTTMQYILYMCNTLCTDLFLYICTKYNTDTNITNGETNALQHTASLFFDKHINNKNAHVWTNVDPMWFFSYFHVYIAWSTYSLFCRFFLLWNIFFSLRYWFIFYAKS